MKDHKLAIKLENLMKRLEWAEDFIFKQKLLDDYIEWLENNKKRYR
tara:strand:+ start:695 stop:832 length:138 start_codon:yes stop_codon:yes gene_type:complete